ncbi:MAG: hypothetical protein EOP18_08040 [Rhizobiaceae bacterium]|nr:MAG: hypothetical protein EOP18_08040 [Rhizobiaceae bacterium]
MMRYVLVISPTPLNVDPSEDAGNQCGVWFEAMGSDVSDWRDEPEQHARLCAIGPDRTVYALHWKDLTVLRAVLARTIARDDVILDDGYELFVTGSKFVELLARNIGNRWWLGGQYD